MKQIINQYRESYRFKKKSSRLTARALTGIPTGITAKELTFRSGKISSFLLSFPARATFPVLICLFTVCPNTM